MDYRVLQRTNMGSIDVDIERVQRRDGQFVGPPHWRVTVGQKLSKRDRGVLKANGWEWSPTKRCWWKW